MRASVHGGQIFEAFGINGLVVGVRDLVRGGGADGACTSRRSRQEGDCATWA